MCTSEAVGKCLVDAVEQLNGLCLRPNGGLYWLPDSVNGSFSRIVEAVEGVSETVVTTAVWEGNTRTIRVVKEKLLEEVTAGCKEILADITDGGDHDDDYYERRKARVMHMLRKVEDIETTLEESLLDARSSLELVNQALVQSVMLAL